MSEQLRGGPDRTRKVSLITALAGRAGGRSRRCLALTTSLARSPARQVLLPDARRDGGLDQDEAVRQEGNEHTTEGGGLAEGLRGSTPIADALYRRKPRSRRKPPVDGTSEREPFHIHDTDSRTSSAAAHPRGAHVYASSDVSVRRAQ
jgi:hypothetical protein